MTTPTNHPHRDLPYLLFLLVLLYSAVLLLLTKVASVEVDGTSATLLLGTCGVAVVIGWGVTSGAMTIAEAVAAARRRGTGDS